jgi:mannosyltransferase OCH1-like enzyme
VSHQAMIKELVPDMPEEFDRLPYPACISDLIRTALLVHHGGFYFDTDFLVQKPLAPIADMLSK